MSVIKNTCSRSSPGKLKKKIVESFVVSTWGLCVGTKIYTLFYFPPNFMAYAHIHVLYMYIHMMSLLNERMAMHGNGTRREKMWMEVWVLCTYLYECDWEPPISRWRDWKKQNFVKTFADAKYNIFTFAIVPSTEYDDMVVSI